MTITTFLRCECRRYDSKTDTWTIVAPINTPRDAVGVCVLGDKLYAVGGYDGSMYRHDVEAYDPQTNDWTKVTDLAVITIQCESKNPEKFLHFPHSVGNFYRATQSARYLL